MNWTFCTGAKYGGVVINGVVRFGHGVVHRGQQSQGDYSSRFVKLGLPMITIGLQLRDAIAPLELLSVEGPAELICYYTDDASQPRRRIFDAVRWLGVRDTQSMIRGESGMTPVWNLDGVIDSEKTLLTDLIVDESNEDLIP